MYQGGAELHQRCGIAGRQRGEMHYEPEICYALDSAM